ncbi:hypothetical protein H6796_01225 [Candidatus Nomurabacteria bacterium]|nr:hypothetical protein [Candidatus Nomurabacteria bacterium]
MKKTDIAMIILIASLAAGIAYFSVSSISMLKPPSEPVEVDYMDKFSSTTVAEPDPTIFNKQAINPTVKVTIGEEED